MITNDKVLQIVDRCFHAYASYYRNDAREMAEESLGSIVESTSCKTCTHHNNLSCPVQNHEGGTTPNINSFYCSEFELKDN